MIKQICLYYHLTKPGIIRGNLITATGGFLFASINGVNFLDLLLLLIGTTFVIASGCVFNNIIDHNIDKKMTRTKKRALVTGEISIQKAVLFGIILLTMGIISLFYINSLTLLVGLTGFVFYVGFYSVWKRRSSIGTIVGSVSGAVPPVAGYTAVTGTLDIVAFTLFLILVFWQMPHFYAIAIYRSKEYDAAQIPVLPLVSGVSATKRQMIAYIILFILSCLALASVSHAGVVYALVMLATGSYWLISALRSYHMPDQNIWAKQVFRTSLLVILFFSISISMSGLTT